MTTIRSIECSVFHVPLDEVLVDAKHGDHTHFELIVATVTTEDGASGVGYSYTGGKGGYAIRAMIEHGGMTFDGTERWLGDVTLDDEAIYTNRAVTSAADGDRDNFEGDGDMDDNKRAFCCLRITN